MRKVLVLTGLTLLAAVLLRVAPSAQSVATAYLTPPKVVADIMDAEPLPGVTLSPDRRTLLLSHRHSMPSIAQVSAPFYRLGGSRINPRTNGPRVLSATFALTVKDVASGAERKLTLPTAESYSGAFSPDGRKLAVTITTSNSTQLAVADVATGTVTPVLGSGVNGLGGGCNWLDDSSGFLCALIPDGRGAAPAEPAVPTGPAVQENDGRTAPGATYEDLLKNPYDESLYQVLLHEPARVGRSRRPEDTDRQAGDLFGHAAVQGHELACRHARKTPVLVRRAGLAIPALGRAVGQDRQAREDARRRPDG